MAAKDDTKRPIIIKKVKKGGHGYHGGAWKVAYADFVTAMIAFFLLLWLLSTTSKATLEGLAEYFTPTEGIKDSMGIGFKGGLAQSEVGISQAPMSAPGIVAGQAQSGSAADAEAAKAKEESDKEENLFKQGATAIEQSFSQDKGLAQYQDNINIQQTPEGLKIDVMDSDEYAMFQPGTAQLSEHGMAIIGRMANILKKLPNYMSVTGHTDASPLESGRADYTSWELSSDRAQSARRYLVKAGIEPERPKKVVGMADKELMTPNEPRGPKNRRLSLIMLKGSHMLIPDSHSAVPPAAAPVAAPLANAAPATPAPSAH